VQIQQEMTKQLNLAKDVRAKYQAKEPDWYDLVPVRNRVLVQKITGNFDVLVARGVIAERDTAEWWKKFAFEVATDAAIVVATFATAGAAPLMAGIVAGVVAAGLPGAQAYLASEKADELAKVEQATVLPGTDLAAQMQVDALRAEALAKKIELFINALTVLGGLAPAIRMELRLARLLELPALEQKVLIASSVLEKGGVYTAERTGLTLGELAARAGPESEAGKRLGREFADLLAKGSAGMSPAERAALRDAGLTAAGEVASAAGGDSETEAEPEVETRARFWSAQMPVVAPTASRAVVQRKVYAPPTWGPAFEEYVHHCSTASSTCRR
jgi:hypothetical protein